MSGLASQPLAVGRTAEIHPWKNGHVLKLFFPTWSAAHAEHEAALTRSLYRQGLPVPRVEEIVEIAGRKGIVLERLDGVSMLRELQQRPWRLPHLAREMARLHAAIHDHSLPDLPSLTSYLETTLQAVDLPEPWKHELLKRLASLPDGEAICHDDFHPDNILLTRRGPVVLDWPTAKRGNPLFDIARTSTLLRAGAPPPGTTNRWLIQMGRGLFHALYLRSYRQLQPDRMGALDAYLPIMAAARLYHRIPGEDAYLRGMVETFLNNVGAVT